MIDGRMWWRRAILGVGLAALTAGCTNPFGRQYEYEEQYYLAADGSVTVEIDASVPALIALRGLAFDPSPASLLDRARVRTIFEGAGCTVLRVAAPWRRNGRRFIQVTVTAPTFTGLSACAPLSWWLFRPIDPDPAGGVRLHQEWGAAAGVDPGAVNWDGSEVVGVKLHLPAKVLDHNARDFERNVPRDLERGNILTWEQRLSDRRASQRLVVDVRMEGESILYRTLWLFAAAFGAAAIAMVVVIFWIKSRGRSNPRPQP